MKIIIPLNLSGDLVKKFAEDIVAFTPKAISAFLLLFVGLYAIRFINRLIRKIMIKRELDPTLSNFVADIVLWGLRVLLFVTFISKLGIETTSFVAILGAAGLAVGMALQGSLSNFAGGVLIILFKPFRVGDTIEAQGVTGTVQEIEIFVTKLIAPNNQTIFIPNGILSNGTITNYSIQGMRRVDHTFLISYNSDLKLAKETALLIMNNNPKILKEPAPSVSVKGLTDNAVQLAIRPWCKNEDYGNVFAEILDDCILAFKEKGIDFQPSSKAGN